MIRIIRNDVTSRMCVVIVIALDTVHSEKRQLCKERLYLCCLKRKETVDAILYYANYDDLEDLEQ